MTYSLPFRDEIIADNFAGGGGASTGLEAALGRPVDVAVDHDPEALALHAANHPATTHYCESVFRVDPEAITGNQPVGLAWFSPDIGCGQRLVGDLGLTKARHPRHPLMVRADQPIVWGRR